METFIGRREQEQGNYTRQKAVWLFQDHFPLAVAGVWQAEDLISADKGDS